MKEELKSIKAFVPMRIPTVTHNDLIPIRRNGKASIAKSAELHEAEAHWEAHLGSEIHIENPLHGPLRAFIQFRFMPRVGDPKRQSGMWHTDKPDADNIEKTFWDIMTRIGAIKDDCLVCKKDIEKIYAHPPGVAIWIQEMEKSNGKTTA